jgi:AraC family transcriptional activator of pobA
MAAKHIPVYQIDAFHKTESATDFYCNTLKAHLNKHHFIFVPHKHDFYVCMLFIKGSGTHDIDFKKYPVKPGAVFFLKPGQMHNWVLSPDADGFIFFHSRAFYDLCFTHRKLGDFSFYGSGYTSPALYLKAGQDIKTHPATLLFTALHKEFTLKMAFLHKERLTSLTDLIYIDLARRLELSETQGAAPNRYLQLFREFEQLVDTRFKEMKSPAAYASEMSMTGKHLNRICQNCIGKTASEVISDRLILEAKRLLLQPGYTVSDIANELGMFDLSYFTRMFKKKTGETPFQFSKQFG